MKNLKKLIAIAVASSMVMSTTVFAKTTTANKTANYQKADTTYGENFQNLLTETGLPSAITSIITSLYNKYGMSQQEADDVMLVVNNLKAYADGLKAQDATLTYKAVASTQGFQSYAMEQGQIITQDYGVSATPTYDANGKMSGVVIKNPRTGVVIDQLNLSDYSNLNTTNVSKDVSTLMNQLQTALSAAVEATAKGTTTEMPVATPTATATSTGTTATGTTTGTETVATATTGAATGTTTGGTTNPGAGAGTGGDVATGITYGQAFDKAIAATGLPSAITSIITSLYDKYGMTQQEENDVILVANNLRNYADNLKANDATLTYKEILKTTAFQAYAMEQGQIITQDYGVSATPTYDANGKISGVVIKNPRTGEIIKQLNISDYSNLDTSTVSHDPNILLAQLKTALDAAVAASTYGSTTVIPTATGTATTGTTTTGTTTAPTTPVQDLANTLTELKVPTDFVTTITNVLNALPTSVQNAVANIFNTFLKSARSATDLAAAKAAIDADTTLTTAQKDAAKLALDKAAALLPATGTTTGTTTGTGTGTTTGTATVAGGSSNGTTPSVLPKTATEAANMAVAGLAMITVAGTIFFISKKRMA